MAKFYGAVGYATSVETAPDVWQDLIVERNLSGDEVRNTVTQRSGEKVNNDLSVGNSISVVADAYAYENFHAIRYVKWLGARWTVGNREVRRPRIILSLGDVYHGPTPEAP